MYLLKNKFKLRSCSWGSLLRSCLGFPALTGDMDGREGFEVS